MDSMVSALVLPGCIMTAVVVSICLINTNVLLIHTNHRFCGLKGHEMFCEVERSYIEDGFNLYGLRACVSNFSDCLDLILDRIGPDDSDDSHLTQSACTLYGLIHARYIITAHGLDAMYNKVSLSNTKLLVVDSLDTVPLTLLQQ